MNKLLIALLALAACPFVHAQNLEQRTPVGILNVCTQGAAPSTTAI